MTDSPTHTAPARKRKATQSTSPRCHKSLQWPQKNHMQPPQNSLPRNKPSKIVASPCTCHGAAIPSDLAAAPTSAPARTKTTRNRSNVTKFCACHSKSNTVHRFPCTCHGAAIPSDLAAAPTSAPARTKTTRNRSNVTKYCACHSKITLQLHFPW